MDEIIARHHVDKNRVYLTGMSMGGQGTWFSAVQNPERFAAIVPICGWGIWMHGFPERVSILKDMPIWAFHGAKDEIIPLKETEALVQVLRDRDGNIRFTVYPEAEHDSWTETYENPELYTWFLQHTLQNR